MDTNQIRAHFDTLKHRARAEQRNDPSKRITPPRTDTIAGLTCTLTRAQSGISSTWFWLLKISRIPAHANLYPWIVDLIGPELARLAGARDPRPEPNSGPESMIFRWWPNGDRVFDLDEAIGGLQAAVDAFHTGMAVLTLTTPLDELGSSAREAAYACRTLAESFDALGAEIENRLSDRD